MNIEEEILMELRTIKMLMTIDKKDELEEISGDLTAIQKHLIGLLDAYEWRSLSTSDIADILDVANRTIRDHRAKLEKQNLFDKRGQKSGAEYRITGLLGSVELLGLIELD